MNCVGLTQHLERNNRIYALTTAMLTPTTPKKRKDFRTFSCANSRVVSRSIVNTMLHLGISGTPRISASPRNFRVRISPCCRPPPFPRPLVCCSLLQVLTLVNGINRSGASTEDCAAASGATSAADDTTLLASPTVIDCSKLTGISDRGTTASATGVSWASRVLQGQQTRRLLMFFLRRGT